MVALKSGLEIEVLSAADAARRRQWSEADKLRIVEVSLSFGSGVLTIGQ